MIVRLPWAGDLGMHAATLQRLRHSLLHPGNPLVDADTPSPYYSPWMLVLGVLARATGLSVFVVLRIGALAGLALLVTGVWRYVRTLTGRPAAPALAVLCLLFLWGPLLFEWSGFLGLNSLALTVSYPSVFALGLSFHFWAWLTRSLRAPAGWWAWAALGALWAVILLVHQFSGVVASLGALATIIAAMPGRKALPRPGREAPPQPGREAPPRPGRKAPPQPGQERLPGPGRETLPRLGAAVLLGAVVLWVWPYYDFFALFSAGADLEAVHRPLYQHLPGRFGLVLLGVVALGLRWRRDRRDPLVIFFVLGAVVFAAGGLSGHYSWGRALPAALIPAQLAAALEAVSAGRRAVRTAWACVLGAALLVGAWAQAGTLGYATGRAALPGVIAAKYRTPWTGYQWITPWVKYGDVVMTRTFPARQIPAYGPYTVAPGYPDVFLPDAERRQTAVRRYFDAGTSDEDRRGIVREYGVRWVVDRAAGVRDGRLRRVTRGPGGQVLYAVR